MNSKKLTLQSKLAAEAEPAINTKTPITNLKNENFIRMDIEYVDIVKKIWIP